MGVGRKIFRVIVIDEITAHDWPINNQCHRDQQQAKTDGIAQRTGKPGFPVGIVLMFSRNHLARSIKPQISVPAGAESIRDQRPSRENGGWFRVRVVCCMDEG
jgi:hypothetical protein